MKFRTEINLQKADFGISYADRLFFMGSCFSSNIGDRLLGLKFPTLVNPTGVLYNPASICMMLERINAGLLFKDEDFFCEGGVWNSFHLHSSFSSLSLDEIKSKANAAVQEAADCLHHTTRLFLTLGTAWVYHLVEGGTVVANCHKRPAREFVRERLSVDEIVELFIPVLQNLIEANPDLKIIFTVSPIRHWKDGAHGNQLSKATLMLGIDQLQEIFPENVRYFPAYELLMDDLRDYRFYASDLLHPSDQAVDYIFDQFISSYMSDEVQNQMKKISSIISAASHRPLNPDSFDYKLFCSRNLDLINALKKQLPLLDFSAEQKLFEKYI